MSTTYLLDTNVLSELMRSRPAESVLAWLAQQTPASLYTSTITVAEIQAGLVLMPAGQRQQALKVAAAAVFEQDFAARIWAFDVQAADCYATVTAVRQRAGRPIGHADAQIAALAINRGAILVTRNVADFDGIDGLTALNPWIA